MRMSLKAFIPAVKKPTCPANNSSASTIPGLKTPTWSISQSLLEAIMRTLVPLFTCPSTRRMKIITPL